MLATIAATALATTHFWAESSVHKGCPFATKPGSCLACARAALSTQDLHPAADGKTGNKHIDVETK
jgi:hypothetical protein